MAPHLGDGGFGEYAVVSEAFTAVVPDGVDMASAGALGLAGAAALAAIDSLELQPGRQVLIVGATGGVGSIAIQYAAAAGSTVIATAGPGVQSDFVRRLGAASVVDPDEDLGVQIKALADEGVDAIVHLAGDPTALPSLLKTEGRIASTVGFGAEQDPAAVAVRANPDTGTLDRLAADVASGRIRLAISQTISLPDVPAAIAAFPGGTLGKHAIVIR